jgi:hypothetical protein
VSRSVLFTIGTVVFFAVTTAVIIYGQNLFRRMEGGDIADTAGRDAASPKISNISGTR